MGFKRAERALFLDRDGVINIDKRYVYLSNQIEFVDNIFDLCRYAVLKKYVLIVVTNQSGIGRGYFTEKQFLDLMSWMQGVFKVENCPIGCVYYCPYHQEHPWRKPNPGMILQAKKDFNLDLSSCLLVGDKETDIQAGEAAGVGRNLLLGEGKIDNLSRVKDFL